MAASVGCAALADTVPGPINAPSPSNKGQQWASIDAIVPLVVQCNVNPGGTRL